MDLARDFLQAMVETWKQMDMVFAIFFLIAALICYFKFWVT
jgi:hypothetical protein